MVTSELLYYNSCKNTYHHKDKHKQVDRDRVEVVFVLNAIRFVVFEKSVLKDVNNDAVFTKAHNLLSVLTLCQYSSQ